MPAHSLRFDSDHAEHLTAGASRPTEPDTAEKAARYVTRRLGDDAGEVLRALGLAPVQSKPWRRA